MTPAEAAQITNRNAEFSPQMLHLMQDINNDISLQDVSVGYKFGVEWNNFSGKLELIG